MSQTTASSTYQQLVWARDNINQLVQQVSDAQCQVGHMYSYVVTQRLAESQGYKSAWDYLGRHIKGISRTSLALYGNVAVYISQASVAKYGTERIRAWLNYLRARHVSVPLTDPGTVLVGVPLEGRADTTLWKPLSECSVDDVRRATRAVRSRGKARIAVTDAVRSLFLKDSIEQHFKDIATVRLNARNQDGKTLVTLYDVPVEEMARLVQALQAGMEAQPASLKKRAA
jgi:hypothetical protein